MPNLRDDITTIQLSKEKKRILENLKRGSETFEDVLEGLLKIYKWFLGLGKKMKVEITLDDTVESVIEKTEGRIKEVLGD